MLDREVSHMFVQAPLGRHAPKHNSLHAPGPTSKFLEMLDNLIGLILE